MQLKFVLDACSRQRRCYPRAEPHGTWRNGRVCISVDIHSFVSEQRG